MIIMFSLNTCLMLSLFTSSIVICRWDCSNPNFRYAFWFKCRLFLCLLAKKISLLVSHHTRYVVNINGGIWVSCPQSFSLFNKCCALSSNLICSLYPSTLQSLTKSRRHCAIFKIVTYNWAFRCLFAVRNTNQTTILTFVGNGLNLHSISTSLRGILSLFCKTFSTLSKKKLRKLVQTKVITTSTKRIHVQ